MKKHLLSKVLILQVLILMTFVNIGHAKDWTVTSLKITVEGRVTDDTGAPLPGVNIIEKGTTNGAVSDSNGNYKLEANDENSVLVFSFIGFATKEVTVGSRSTINVSMAAD